jgi:glycosyltransferase involved in cell wall biosynthesis
MSKRSIRILTNIRRLNQSFLPDAPLSFSSADSGHGLAGAIKFISQCLRTNIVILDEDDKGLLLACALKCVLPFERFRIVSVDLVLRRPTTLAQRFKARLKRILLSRVDRCVLYFKDLRGYERFYGIGPDRAVYVPFKVNDWDKIQSWSDANLAEAYVMCAGRTMRDVKTFVEAIRLSGCPGLLHQQKPEVMAKHGTLGWNGDLPPNLRLVIDDSYQHEVFLDFIAQARLVVVPRFRNDIGPAGIATYLVAMALNKCVIISEGPGAEDVLDGQAVIVPPENPERLAEEIKRLWNDEELRARVAARGYEYAMSLGGYERLLSDILRTSIELVCGENLSPTDKVSECIQTRPNTITN